MRTVSAQDVADELRRRLPGLGAVQQHKLLYYAQGWHLAMMGRPLFDEAVEAWANGPVVGVLWADEKHGRGRPVPQELDDEHLATVDYVVGRYGRFTSRELIHLTHNEDPWRNASLSEEAGDLAVRSPVITHDALRSWFEADDQFGSMAAAVARRRSRKDVYSFEPCDVAGLDAAVERAVRGERVRHDTLPVGQRPAS